MNLRTIALWTMLLTTAFGCSDAPKSTVGPDMPVKGAASALISGNGVWQNGLTTNGVWQNGVWQNGVWQNGVWQNGVWQNGVWQNGVWQNGVWQNGVWQNGVWQNGVWQNGVWQNGVWQNGVWQNGVWQNGVWQNGLQGRTLRSSQYARQLLQYVYACAMPGTLDPSGASIYDTTLDPNNGSLTCSSSAGCDSGYTCFKGNCVVQLRGAIGVGINTDGSSWWASGKCDESCQRWISACVLARANAYGVHVDISMRAPETAPQAIRDALATTEPERATYRLREGAYYGNIFATTADPPPPPSPNYTGPATGPIAATGIIHGAASFYACAGPDSNTPEITKRFCSSQGDQVVINVPGTCLATEQEPAVCDGIDGTGSIYGCNTNTDGTQPRTHYDEVITVYLKTPIAVCGNGVCEADEDASANTAYCPSDCRPGSWAKSPWGKAQAGGSDVGFNRSVTSAIDPVDGSVVVAGIAYASTEVVVDRNSVPAISLPGAAADMTWDIVFTKHDAGGSYKWGKRVQFIPWIQPRTVRVKIASDQTIIAAGTYAELDESGMVAGSGLWFAKLGKDGSVMSQFPLASGSGGSRGGWVNGDSWSVDSKGDFLVLGSFSDTVTFGSTQLNQLDGKNFLAKFCGSARSDCAFGDVDWAIALPTSSSEGATSLALDASDDAIIGGYSGSLYKVSGATGTVGWASAETFGITGVAANPSDPDHAFYLTGTRGAGFKALKYAADRSVLWSQTVEPPTSKDGLALTLDDAGQVIVAGQLGSYTQVDFGAGQFTSYRFPNLFVTAYRASDGAFSWAKAVPMILGGPPEPADSQYLSFGSAKGRLLLSGTYAGSMLLDGHLLVSAIPESLAEVNPFVGSFSIPSLLDVTPPAIGAAKDQIGTSIQTVPKDIFVQATSASGATVFYMPPTAVDADNSGTSVACTPPPNTTFPLGLTKVTCTASDALGNHASAVFNVTVADSIGPIFAPIPDITVPAIGANGATVTYAYPTANDQVDGASTQVVCSPPSGNVFPPGKTTVTCSASDKAQNASHTSFSVIVQGGDTAAPSIGVPAPMTVDATNASGAVVTYNASATDDVAVTTFECNPASGSVFALGATTVTCNASDAAGNHSSATFGVSVVDRTPPAVTVPAAITGEATGPSGASVVYTAAAVDGVDGTVPATCVPSSGSIFPLGSTLVTCTAGDAAGNSASKTFTVTVVDTTRPTLTLPGPIAAIATSAKGATVTYAASATDTVGGPITPVCTPASGSIFPLGTTTASCKATDARGNAVTGAFQAKVTYAWSGFLPPIDSSGNSLFKLGRTVPVKFRLTGASAAITNAVAKLTFTKTSSKCAGSHVEADSNATATSGNTFRYESGQYVFNLSTKNLSAGTWKLSVDLGDGVSRTVSISLQK
jgi:hypothetical protein